MVTDADAEVSTVIGVVGSHVAVPSCGKIVVVVNYVVKPESLNAAVEIVLHPGTAELVGVDENQPIIMV